MQYVARQALNIRRNMTPNKNIRCISEHFSNHDEMRNTQGRSPEMDIS